MNYLDIIIGIILLVFGFKGLRKGLIIEVVTLLAFGVGIYGATYAYKAKKEGKRCLVIDQRPHLGGNIYCDLKYKELAEQEKNVIFGGRLAEYKYYDIAPIIEKVMEFNLHI